MGPVTGRFDGSRLDVRAAVSERTAIDLRAIAAFRVAIGAILLVDLLLRSRSVVAFYSDDGVLPRETLVALYPTLSRLSLHALSGSVAYQVALFVFAGAVAVSLLVGYRARLAAVLSFVLLVSLQTRNYAVLNGGDTVLLLLCFFAVFLPLSERWAVDAVGREVTRARISGIVPATLLVQIVLVYATNAVFKLRGDAWLAGDAIHRILSIDRYATPIGAALTASPPLLSVLTWLWLGLLVASPLLLATTGRRRGALATAFVVAHVGMAVTMPLGLFPAAMIAGLLLFLPAALWDVVEAQLRSAGFDTSTDDRVVRSRHRLRTACFAVLLAGSVGWQLLAVGAVATPERAPVDPVDHSWKLFAPEPPSTEGWYVVSASLSDGSAVDARRLAPVSWDRPPDAYETTRWRKYLTALRSGDDRRVAAFADYYCVQTDDRTAASVTSVTVYFVERASDGETSQVELGEYDC